MEKVRRAYQLIVFLPLFTTLLIALLLITGIELPFQAIRLYIKDGNTICQSFFDKRIDFLINILNKILLKKDGDKIYF